MSLNYLLWDTHNKVNESALKKSIREVMVDFNGECRETERNLQRCERNFARVDNEAEELLLERNFLFKKVQDDERKHTENVKRLQKELDEARRGGGNAGSGEIARLTEELRVAKLQLTKCHESYAKLHEYAEEMDKERDVLRQKAEDDERKHTENVERLEKELDEARRGGGNAGSGEIARLSDELRVAKEKLEASKHELENCRESESKTTAQLVEAQEKLNVSEDRVSKKQQEIDLLKSQRSPDAAALVTAQKELAALRRERDGMREEFEKRETDWRRELDERMKNIQASFEKTTKELKEAKEQSEIRRQSVQQLEALLEEEQNANAGGSQEALKELSDCREALGLTQRLWEEAKSVQLHFIKRNDELQAKYDAFQKQAAQISKDYLKEISATQDERRRKEELQREILAVEAKLKAATARVGALETELAQKTEEANASLKKREEDAAGHRLTLQQLATATSGLEEANVRVEKLTGQLGKANEDLQACQKDKTKVEDKNVLLTADLRNSKNELEQANLKLKTAISERDDLFEQLDRHEARYNVLQERAAQLGKDNLELLQRDSAGQAGNDLQLRQELDEARAEIGAVNEKLREANARVIELGDILTQKTEEANESLRKCQEDSERQRLELGTTIDGLNTALVSKLGEIKELQGQRATLQGSIDKAMEKGTSQGVEIETMKETKEELDSKIRGLEMDMENFKRQIGVHKSEIKDLLERLDRANSRSRLTDATESSTRRSKQPRVNGPTVPPPPTALEITIPGSDICTQEKIEKAVSNYGHTPAHLANLYKAYIGNDPARPPGQWYIDGNSDPADTPWLELANTVAGASAKGKRGGSGATISGTDYSPWSNAFVGGEIGAIFLKRAGAGGTPTEEKGINIKDAKRRGAGGTPTEEKRINIKDAHFWPQLQPILQKIDQSSTRTWSPNMLLKHIVQTINLCGLQVGDIKYMGAGRHPTGSAAKKKIHPSLRNSGFQLSSMFMWL